MRILITPWPRKPIAAPGIYSGMPIEVYHSATCCVEPSISSSGLRTIFRQSPAHYWAFSVYNKNRYEQTASPLCILGSATHHLLLGEANFKAKFARRPDTIGGVKWSGRGPACETWLADHSDKTIITTVQGTQVVGMYGSLREEPLIKAGVLNGQIECSFVWKDKETGIWLKARPDAVPNDSLDFADLKTTTSVMPDDLRRTIHEYGYFQQAALIAEGCFAVTGFRMNSFTLVFVESKPPHCCAVVTLKESEIDRGMMANRKSLRTFAQCMASGKWPGPYGDQADARYIEMMPWDQKQIDHALSVPSEKIQDVDAA